jgi:hydroxymethylbilane synthase
MTNFKRKVRIGTRGSELALWQAYFIQAELKTLGVESELKIIKTKGDKIQDLSFDKLEGKGFFTKEIEESLLNNEVDLAVHSHKDLPTVSPEGLKIAAVSHRAKPNELLIINNNSIDESQFLSVKKGAVIGTSSARRKSILLSLRPDVEIQDIRGNVQTRLRKLQEGGFDAILMAAAGLERLNLNPEGTKVIEIDTDYFIPAPAQGVLAFQIREDDAELAELLSKINNIDSEECIRVERTFLNKFGGGCHSPLAAYCKKEGDKFKVWTALATEWNDLPKRLYFEFDDTFDKADMMLEEFKKISPKKVFISRNETDSSIFKHNLLANKFSLVCKSLIKTEKIKFSNLPDCDWIFFSSKNAVKFFFEQKPNLLKEVKFAAIGDGTALFLKQYVENIDFVGYSNDIKRTAEDFGNLAEGKIVLFPQAKDSLKSVQKQLSFNIKALDLYVYKTTSATNEKMEDFDIYVFTSPSNVTSFNINNTFSHKAKYIAIGKSTASKLKELKINNVITAHNTHQFALLESVYRASID